MTKPAIRPGDIFQLGEHLLLCGDCRDAGMIAKFIGSRKIALVLTDPPYGIAYVEGKANFLKGKVKHMPIANDHLQSDESYRMFTRSWLEAVRPFLTRMNAAYIFGSDKMLFALRDGMADAGWRFGQLLIWIKQAAVLGRLDYLPMHELICYGWHGVHEFRKAKDKSVLFHPKPTKSVAHATMKPVGLLRRLILNSSRIGDIIYDPFVGSGSTLLAAEQTRRRCLAVEIAPGHCRTTIERFTKLTGIESKKISLTIHA
ncbi:MAG TPA: site-specific DNA-methyltransferase [Candidatus Peribacterales bacterium]|nr:site-specific DNA-methyltransferase [Candidatus Peribacterales bacterium]